MSTKPGQLEDHWERAKPIFEACADLPPAERSALLDRSCADDAGLRAYVESLLDAHIDAGGFLREPAIDPNAFLAAASTGRQEPADAVGTRIGRYKLLERIGEGGFGAVYMAEQDEPVRRRVAVKIIKPGMDTRQVIARFEAERQALALMDHPNIARVFDAGETPSGRPYFVMELVRGDPITTYCDANRLSPRERIELLVPVCLAVQHAHQKGVIHRDLKPANVLIALHDDRPVPKIIDFGIAKAIDNPLTDRTLFTEFRQFVGTPTYMSPEQAGRSALDIDTRTDVYSIGVLLYELLTGTTPVDSQTLSRATIDEVQRLIREVDPPRPSTRLGSLTRSGARGGTSDRTLLDEIARARRSDPESLRNSISGEPDWITMKCLEKDRSRRYDSAGDLARDLQRFLHNEPVAAGPPSTVYRLRKLATRHRTALSAAVVVSLAVLGGLAVSTYGLIAANRARAAAERQRLMAEMNAAQARSAAARAEAVAAFLRDMLATADPKVQARRDLTVRAALDEAARKVDQGSLNGQPDIEASVRTTIGRAYRELANYPDAQEQLQQALRVLNAAGDRDSRAVAIAMQELGAVFVATGAYTEAEKLFRHALAINEKLLDPNDPAIASTLNDLGTTISTPEQAAEAEALLRRALAIARLPQNQNAPILAEATNNLGFLYATLQRDAEAEPLYREAIALNRRLLGATHPNVATNLDNLATILGRMKRFDEAEAAYREALATRRKVFGNQHPDVGTSLHNLAHLIASRPGFDPATVEPLLQEALPIFKNSLGLGHPDTLTVAESLAHIVGLHDLNAAQTILLEAYSAAESSPLVHDERRRGIATRLASLYSAMNNPDEADRWKARAATPAPAAASTPATQPAS